MPSRSLPSTFPDGSTKVRRALSGFVVLLLALGGVELAATSAQAVSGGTAVAWGAADFGQIAVPSSLAGKTVTAVAAGENHSLALTSDGQVTGWGNNDAGQTDVPASLAGKTVTAIAAGASHSLALTSDGQVTGWGDNSQGQTAVPSTLAGKTVTAIEAGIAHSLVLTDDGQVTAWGYNSNGQTTVPSGLAGKTVTAIAAGGYHSLALTSDGQVTGWGSDGNGQTTIPSGLGGKTVTAIAAGAFHSLALTSDGQVTAWGNNGNSQTDVPASLGGKTVTAIAAGAFYSLALTSDGQVTGWGDNFFGQTAAPTAPAGKRYAAISAGGAHSLGILVDDSSEFVPGVTATITGTPRVGQTLTADPGAVAPAPDSYGYRWFGDETVIPGADGATFTPTSAQQGKAITVEVSAVKAGYTTSTDTSDTTGPVAAGDITMIGTPTITGTPEVGETLTGDSSMVSTDPQADTTTVQWLRAGAPVPGADGASYVLSNADAGADITFEVRATKASYSDATATSEAVGPVDGGVIALPTPGITGTAVVGGTLSAVLPAGLDPADVVLSFEWFRGATSVGTGNSYSPTSADAGAALTLTARATKAFYDEASKSVQSTQVARAAFSAGPEATISGTVKVGETLTGGAGTVAPAPDSYAYRWFADDTVIPGANSATLILTSAQRGMEITVEVTAVKAGYTDAGDTSAPTTQVASDLAPDLQLDAADPELRRGESTTLTWTSAGADSVTASGAWQGTKASSGSMTLTPSALGESSYVLEASNANGTTTTQVSITVTRPARALAVSAQGGLHLTRTPIAVSIRGLEAGERYTVCIGGVQVAYGTATSSAVLTRQVLLPARARDGATNITVTGSEPDRTGATTTRVVVNKRLGLYLVKRPARVRHLQRATVTGLVSGERVRVTYRGRRISSPAAHATTGGRYQITFRVGRRPGTRTITATGAFLGRRATTTFRVTRH